MIDVVPYVDTSALLKLLVAEEESPAFEAYVRDRGPLPLYSCELTPTELLGNAVKNGAHPEDAGALLQGTARLALDRPLPERAGRLPSSPAGFLRSADAVHIASAITMGADAFLTYDARQGDAARALGLRLLSPA